MYFCYFELAVLDLINLKIKLIQKYIGLFVLIIANTNNIYLI